MINSNTFGYFAWANKLDREDNCPGNCQAPINGLLWINQQPFWTYQCLCCKIYHFKKGKTIQAWENFYD